MSHNTCTQQQNPAREVYRRSLYFLPRHQIFTNIRSYIRTLERDIVMKRYSGDVDAHSQQLSQQGCDERTSPRTPVKNTRALPSQHTPHTHLLFTHEQVHGLARLHAHTDRATHTQRCECRATPTRRVPSQRRSIEYELVAQSRGRFSSCCSKRARKFCFQNKA
jgi:hypothetical protein